MIKLKLPGSSIRLSGTLSCNNNSVWFSKMQGNAKNFSPKEVSAFLLDQIHTGLCFPPSILLPSNHHI